jgi:hypothetical protein
MPRASRTSCRVRIASARVRYFPRPSPAGLEGQADQPYLRGSSRDIHCLRGCIPPSPGHCGDLSERLEDALGSSSVLLHGWADGGVALSVGGLASACLHDGCGGRQPPGDRPAPGRARCSRAPGNPPGDLPSPLNAMATIIAASAGGVMVGDGGHPTSDRPLRAFPRMLQRPGGAQHPPQTPCASIVGNGSLRQALHAGCPGEVPEARLQLGGWLGVVGGARGVTTHPLSRKGFGKPCRFALRCEIIAFGVILGDVLRAPSWCSAARRDRLYTVRLSCGLFHFFAIPPQHED